MKKRRDGNWDWIESKKTEGGMVSRPGASTVWQTTDAGVAALEGKVQETRMDPKIGSTLTLPAGWPIGMGKLRHATVVTIDRIDTNAEGAPMYGIRWTDPKTGRDRTSWIGHDEALGLLRGNVQETTMAKRKPNQTEQAESAGYDYATDQIGGNYFHDWVRDQLIEASKMDPEQVLPLETKADALVVARKMLQQLEWDTKRDLGRQQIEYPEAWFRGFHRACEAAQDGLADELLEMNREIRGPQARLGAPRPGTRVRDYIAVDSRGRKIAGPFKSYSDAKDAAGPGGHTQFVPGHRPRAWV